MNTTELQQFKKDKAKEQLKVIDYFTKDGCCSAFGMMKDDEYLKLVRDRRDSMKLREKAFGKIGLDEAQVKEIAPVCLQGFRFDGAFAKKTAAGRWVSSSYEVAWLFFSNTQIYLYSMRFNLDQDKKEESTQEFFYKDVTALTTLTRNYTSAEDEGKDRVKVLGDKKIEVETTVFQITVPGEKLIVAMDSDEVPGHEAVVQAMKQKLREKKQ
jgi:hypothetical protein